jgi:hypothetical protein
MASARESVGPSVQSPSRRLLLLLVGLFAASRVTFYLAGVRLDTRALTGGVDYLQLLDLHELHHHLIRSIWYLQSQPPAFNLFTGVALHLPPGAVTPVLTGILLVLGLVMVVCCYLLCLELHLPQWLAVALTVLVIADPANLLYANWYFYSFPTATAMMFGGLALARYVRIRSWPWGLATFTTLAVVVLMNSTFQWVWMVLVLVPVLVGGRRYWRSIVVLAFVPVLLVCGWYLKNAVLFGTYTTSSWFGMNLANISLLHAPRGELRTLLREHKVSSLATIKTFEALPAYRHAVPLKTTSGVVVIDRPVKSDGLQNLNDREYIVVADHYLRDDLTYIAADPAGYLHSVAQASVVFFRPQQQTFLLWPNAQRISGYAALYDHVVNWQLHTTDYSSTTLPVGSTSIVWQTGRPSPLSWGTTAISSVVIYAIVLLATPLAVWRRRRDAPLAATLSFIWISTVYVFLVTNLGDFGENMRFRYDVGSLPMLAAAAVIVALLPRRGPPVGVDVRADQGDQEGVQEEVTTSGRGDGRTAPS